MRRIASALACAVIALLAPVVSSAAVVETTAADGVKVYGESYVAGLPASAPVIALFHQARSNGRGEYGPMISWLNGLGYRVIAWDQRSGGNLYGAENRTAAKAKGKKGFCDAYPDMEAAIVYSGAVAAGAPLIIWGSSYSASLVWAAAADHADKIDGVVAFSTASGGALDDCGARKGLPGLADPALAAWPARERGQAKSLDALLRAARVEVLIVENGVHGSSSLVDQRTNADMSAARSAVAAWLTRATTAAGGK